MDYIENIKFEMQPVLYRTKKQVIETPKKNIKKIKESLFIKPKCWSYEEEVRFIIQNTKAEKKDFTFIPFNVNCLKRIIIGPKILENDHEQIADFIFIFNKEYKKTIVSKCKISNSEYKLITENDSRKIIDIIIGI